MSAPGRRKWLTLAALLAGGASMLATGLAGCRSDWEKELGIQVHYQKKKLPNGLTVILVEDHTVPVVSYQTWFHVGSVDEKLGMTGIAHLFEHLMFKGTLRYGPKQFFQELEAKGAEVNAFTTRDYTVYHENFIPTLLEKVIDMESDRMSNLVLTPDVLNSERMVVLEERRMRSENTPEGRLQESLWGLAFQLHPYRWPVIGFPQDLMGLSVKDLEDFYRANYQPKNAAIVVVGDLDTNRTFELLRRYYGKTPGVKVADRRIPAEPEQREERRLILRDQVASERFIAGYHIPAADSDDSYALDVLANILFEGTDSRGYRRLVDEKDILSSVSGTAYTPAYPGLFIIGGTLQGKLKTEVAEKELGVLIHEAQERDATDAEIRRAVRQLTVQLVDSVRTPFGLGQLIGIVQTVFDDPERFATDLAKYTKVTPADVRRVARKYLQPANRSTVTLVPGPPPAPELDDGEGGEE